MVNGVPSRGVNYIKMLWRSKLVSLKIVNIFAYFLFRKYKEVQNFAPEHYHIAVSGGGSGGHVYPALAVLERLGQLITSEQPDAMLKVVWLGSKYGIERDILRKQACRSDLFYHLEYKAISCGKLRRYFSWRNFSDLLRIVWGIGQSYFILHCKRPCLLFSKGGFVTFPGIIAAKILGIPVLAHESDLDPGLATRLAVPMVQRLFLPYEQSRQYYKSKYQNKLEISGNPVREEFFYGFYQQDFNAAQNLSELVPSVLPIEWFSAETQLKHPLLLVLGGSLGAQELNIYVRQWLEAKALKPFYLFHQCGSGDYTQYRDLKNLIDKEIKKQGKKEAPVQGYQVVSFISEGLGAIYHICRASGGIIITRSGAGSLWEVLVSDNRAILVPLQIGSRGDQLRNAKFFAQQGWAYCFVREPEFTEHQSGVKQRNSQKLLEQTMQILQDTTIGNQRCFPDGALYIARYIWKQMQQYTKKISGENSFHG